MRPGGVVIQREIFRLALGAVKVEQMNIKNILMEG